MVRDSAPIVAAQVLMRHGLADDVISGYVARTWPLKAHQRDAALATARFLTEQQDAARQHRLRALAEPSGWWTSLSIGELRTVAREHGINVPTGIHRRALVELLVEQDVSKPSRPSPTRARH
jgi:hypothetical protein